ncbi:hypothetical protein LguiA_029706 [Lonicera macranthoides]
MLVSMLPGYYMKHDCARKISEAIRTGILSIRWKSVWASVLTLDLSKEDFKLYVLGGLNEHFTEDVDITARDFVDRALVGRKMHFLEKGCH